MFYLMSLQLHAKLKGHAKSLMAAAAAGVIIAAIVAIVVQKPIDTKVDSDGATPVRVADVEARDLKKTFSTYSAILPWRDAAIKPQYQGVIRDVWVKVGDEVKRDQKLFNLTSEAQQLKSELDRIEFEMRDSDYRVAATLARKNFISKKEHEQKGLELRSSQIRARLSFLDHGGLYVAPFDGLVAEIGFRVGDLVDPSGQSGMRIVDISRLKSTFWLPQNVATQINLDSEVTARQDDVTAPAKIITVSPTVDQKTGSVYAEAELTQIPENWRAGQYMQLEVTLEKSDSSLAIPRAALVKEDGGNYVYLVQSEGPEIRSPANSTGGDTTIARRVAVRPGLSQGDWISVTGELKELDQVIIEGLSGLKDGTAIDIRFED